MREESIKSFQSLANAPVFTGATDVNNIEQLSFGDMPKDSLAMNEQRSSVLEFITPINSAVLKDDTQAEDFEFDKNR